MDDTLKVKFAVYVIGIIAAIQGGAWYFGHNGQVFAFTSLVIGLTVGSVLGFSFKK